MNGSESRNTLERFFERLHSYIDGPCTWFRESVVLPNQKHYPYYHRKFNRVPTIDECEEDEPICMYEANEQFLRDKNVDGQIVTLLRDRRDECIRYEGHDFKERCQKIFDDFTEAELNYFIKYGDLGAYISARTAYMKQKHRLVYERRKEAGTWRPEVMKRGSKHHNYNF